MQEQNRFKKETVLKKEKSPQTVGAKEQDDSTEDQRASTANWTQQKETMNTYTRRWVIQNCPVKGTKRKRVKKEWKTHLIPSNETRCSLWKFRREERKKGPESLLKIIMVENFPNLGREMHIQVHNAQRSPKQAELKKKIKKATSRHIRVELSEVKNKKF